MIRNPSLRSAAIFAASGGAFAVGNLLAASGMPRAEYGRLAIMLAVLVVTSNTGALGFDQLLLRRAIPLTRGYAGRIAASASATGGIAAVSAFALYGIGIGTAAALWTATLVFTQLRAVSAALRRHGHPLSSSLSETASDWILLGIGAAAAAGLLHRCDTAMAVMALAGGLLLALAHVRLAGCERMLPPPAETASRAEAWSLLGIIAAGALLVQGERLLIPVLLSLDDIALFGVVAAVAIAPFRVVSSGIIASLSQQLRRLPCADARRRLLAREMRLFAGLTLLSGGIVCTAAPFAAAWLTQGRYTVSIGLCAAACVNGAAKILQAVPRAVVMGTGSTADLHHFNLRLWLCVAGTALGAALGARGGLEILILGAALGNGIATLGTFGFVRTLLATNKPITV